MVSLAQFEAAATTLGLATNDEGAKGMVDGRPVSLKVTWGQDDEGVWGGVLSIQGLLDPPLDLGLEMHRRQLAFVGVNTVKTGSDDLDTEFSIGGDEPSRSGE